jgi:hypothetical protein
MNKDFIAPETSDRGVAAGWLVIYIDAPEESCNHYPGVKIALSYYG